MMDSENMQAPSKEEMPDIRPLKKVFFIAACALLLALIVAAAISQTVFTVSASSERAEITQSDATYPSISAAAERFDSGSAADWEHAYSYNGTLPSGDPGDYTSIYLYFTAENKSFLDSYMLDAALKSAGKYSDRILFWSDARASFEAPLRRRESIQSKSSGVSFLVLDIYSAGLSEEQLRELVRDIKIEVSASGKFFGTKRIGVSYSSCDAVVFDYSITQK